jgi:hypothetical protein
MSLSLPLQFYDQTHEELFHYLQLSFYSFQHPGSWAHSIFAKPSTVELALKSFHLNFLFSYFLFILFALSSEPATVYYFFIGKLSLSISYSDLLAFHKFESYLSVSSAPTLFTSVSPHNPV